MTTSFFFLPLSGPSSADNQTLARLFFNKLVGYWECVYVHMCVCDLHSRNNSHVKADPEVLVKHSWETPISLSVTPFTPTFNPVLLSLPSLFPTSLLPSYSYVSSFHIFLERLFCLFLKFGVPFMLVYFHLSLLLPLPYFPPSTVPLFFLGSSWVSSVQNMTATPWTLFWAPRPTRAQDEFSELVSE